MLEVIFKVPDHVLLPEDAAQRTKHSEKEHKKILREIESIKSDIQMVLHFTFYIFLMNNFCFRKNTKK